jgi:L-alanine-DL-glutamate epimerase-like enolase superfamily enzyme
MVEVPSGPGLGVVYDWDFIKSRTKQVYAFDLKDR